MRKTVLIAVAAAGLCLPVLAGCSYHDHDYDRHYRHREVRHYDDCGAPVRHLDRHDRHGHHGYHDRGWSHRGHDRHR